MVHRASGRTAVGAATAGHDCGGLRGIWHLLRIVDGFAAAPKLV